MYWTNCEKCKRAIVSRNSVICHQCETGKEVVYPNPKVHFGIPNLGTLWGLDLDEEDKILFRINDKEVRRKDIKNISEARNGG